MPKSVLPVVALVVAGLGLCAPCPARAGIEYTQAYAQEIYFQTSTNISFTGSNFSLSLNTAGASDYNAATVSIPTTPTATSLQLAYNPVLDSNGTYIAGSVSTYFPSSSGNVVAGLAALNAVYPMGTYTFAATNSTTNASQNATLVYDQNYWPTAPRSSGQTAVPMLTGTSYARLQGLNPNQTQVFNFNTFTGNAIALPGEVNPATQLTIYNAEGQVYASPSLPSGTSSLLLPANTLQANMTYLYVLSFANRLHCAPGSLLCGTNQPVSYGLGFETDTEGEFTTAAIATPPPTSVTLQGGTLANPLALQSQGQIGQVDGLIGGEGAMDFYLFYWSGGTFMANAALTGADPNATYEFEVLDLFGHVLQEMTLNAADNFSADLNQLLSAGTYEVGLLADSPFDPPFAITFVTPVSGVPEPATLGLMLVGLTGLRLTRRRKPKFPTNPTWTS